MVQMMLMTFCNLHHLAKSLLFLTRCSFLLHSLASHRLAGNLFDLPKSGLLRIAVLTRGLHGVDAGLLVLFRGVLPVFRACYTAHSGLMIFSKGEMSGWRVVIPAQRLGRTERVRR